MKDADLVRHLYSYDKETGEFLWLNPPAGASHAKATPGQRAGATDPRDGSLQLRVAGRLFSASKVAWLYVNSEWPRAQLCYRDPELPLPGRDAISNIRMAGVRSELDQETLRFTLNYNRRSGDFTWRVARKGVKRGQPAGSVRMSNGRSYRYIRIEGVDHLAPRLAWLYERGSWPEHRLVFSDGDTLNCAIDNLSESTFRHGTRQDEPLTDEERRVRQAETYRRHDLMRDFGLTPAGYQAMYDAQGGCCAICRQPETEMRQGKVKNLAVDHDHKTGAIRALLCCACNKVLGHGQDDPSLLRKMADYLEAHAAPPPEGTCVGCGEKPQYEMTHLLVAENGEVEGPICDDCSAQTRKLKGVAA